MNLDEARKVAEAVCASYGLIAFALESIAENLQAAFPQFVWAFWQSEETYKIGITVTEKEQP